MIRTTVRARAALRSSLPSTAISYRHPSSIQTFSTSDVLAQADASSAPLNPRWLSDLKTRLGKCIHFGMTSSQVTRAGSLLSEAKRNETVLRCQRFATESQTVLYVQKDLIASSKVNGTNGHVGMECCVQS